MTDLTILNQLRANAGMKPLKAWKESKAKLAEAIKKLQDKGGIAATVEAAKEEVIETNKQIKEAKKATAKKVKAPAKPAKEKTKEGTGIADLAAELEMDPKVARAKLRRAFPDHSGAWVFTNKEEVAKAKAVLEGDARKKKED